MSGKDTPTWLWIAGGLLLFAALRQQPPKSTRKALPASTGSGALPTSATTTNGAKVSR